MSVGARGLLLMGLAYGHQNLLHSEAMISGRGEEMLDVYQEIRTKWIHK